jgi:hypothetical protein
MTGLDFVSDRLYNTLAGRATLIPEPVLGSATADPLTLSVAFTYTTGEEEWVGLYEGTEKLDPGHPAESGFYQGLLTALKAAYGRLYTDLSGCQNNRMQHGLMAVVSLTGDLSLSAAATQDTVAELTEDIITRRLVSHPEQASPLVSHVFGFG